MSSHRYDGHQILRQRSGNGHFILGPWEDTMDMGWAVGKENLLCPSLPGIRPQFCEETLREMMALNDMVNIVQVEARCHAL